MNGIPLFPPQASSMAAEVDALYFFIIAVSLFFAAAVVFFTVLFGIKYRRRHEGEVGARIEGSLPLELAWSVIPAVISMVMFGWGAKVFYEQRRPPDEALQVYASASSGCGSSSTSKGNGKSTSCTCPSAARCASW
jgi:cytochrome c oxidase subunit 2